MEHVGQESRPPDLKWVALTLNDSEDDSSSEVEVQKTFPPLREITLPPVRGDPKGNNLISEGGRQTRMYNLTQSYVGGSEWNTRLDAKHKK